MARSRSCDARCAIATIAPDRKSFTVDFKQFSLTLDENTRSDRKLCSLVVDVTAPSGQTYALETLQGTGEVKLAAGMEATMTRSVSFTGLGRVGGEKTTTLVGPTSTSFQLADTFTGADLGFAPCDVARSLFIDLGFSIRNSNPPSKGSLTLSNAGPIHFTLRPCSG